MLKENYDIWFEGVERKRYPRGFLPAEAGILIVGGGMAGVTSAYLLAKENKSVILLEKGKIGEGVTHCTTAFLTGVIDTDPIKLIRVFGLEPARLIMASHFEAIAEVEKIIVAEGIDCEFEHCTNYIYANNSKEEKDLIALAEAYNKLGVEAEYKKAGEVKFNQFGYVWMPNHAKFHALKYLTALAALAVKYGAVIAEETEVLKLENKPDYVEAQVKDVGIIKAKKVVSATYTALLGPKSLLNHGNLYREYVAEYKLPIGVTQLGTYEDTLTPYHYFRLDGRDGFVRLIIGGADHLDVLKIDPEINHQAIRKYSQELFKDLKLEEVRNWTGQILETDDGLAYIGELASENIFYIFGFSGNGMTYSYIAGKILLDQLLARDNPYTNIYRLDRKISWWKKLYLK